MNARTIAGVQAQITYPSDVVEYLRAARADLAGTDYPGALELLKALTPMLSAQRHLTHREMRTFHARYILALEGYDDEARENIAYVEEVLGECDFKGEQGIW